MKSIFALICLLPLLLCQCGKSSSHRAGTSTETTNGITVAVLDSIGSRIEGARIVAFTRGNFEPIDTAYSTADGFADLSLGLNDTVCQVEVILGADSAYMAWATVRDDITQILLRSAARLVVRTGLPANSENALPAQLSLQGTPYRAAVQGSEYRFSRIPAGYYDLVDTNQSAVASATLNPGVTLDTLLNVGVAAPLELTFENFDDGDSKHQYSSLTNSTGWYLNVDGDASWISPLTTSAIASAITTTNAWSGMSLTMNLNTGTAGSLVFGTHIGADSNLFDFSKISAIRMMVRGDAQFDFTMEQSTSPVAGKYNKALWGCTSTAEWRQIVLHPGQEKIDASVYQYSMAEVGDSIAIVSFFIRSGTWLQVDDIVFEGLDESAMIPLP